jgi:hypothetical protein
MMNEETKPGMNADEFEKRLQRQPLRQAPCEWRSEILAAARDAQASCHPSPATRHGWLATFNRQLSILLWPHPKAWAGLAAVWVFVFAVNFSLRDPSPQMAEKSAPPSPEVIVELRKQQRLFAELVGPREERDADRSKTYKSHPRTESVAVLTT